MKSCDENNIKNANDDLVSQDASSESLSTEDNNDYVGLPTDIFICKVPQRVFDDDSVKDNFENMCKIFGPAQFIYLSSFRRVRVRYNSPSEAGKAKLALHNTNYLDSTITVYYAQSSSLSEASTSSLMPPTPQKQYLISPPASPPVGWEPVEENKPAFNFDLVSTLIEMAPGQSHELHKSDDGKPSVVVHVCENSGSNDKSIRKIQQTKRPGA